MFKIKITNNLKMNNIKLNNKLFITVPSYRNKESNSLCLERSFLE
jgi:hypothetical protein